MKYPISFPITWLMLSIATSKCTFRSRLDHCAGVQQQQRRARGFSPLGRGGQNRTDPQNLRVLPGCLRHSGQSIAGGTQKASVFGRLKFQSQAEFK